MRTIAMLHYAGPPFVGGVEITMAAHARVLAEAGHRVRIVAGKGGDLGGGVETVLLPELDSRGGTVEAIGRELASGAVSPAFHALVDRLAAQLDQALADMDVAIVHNVLSLHKNLAFTAALHRLIVDGRIPRLLAWCHDFAWRDPLYASELHAGYPWDLLREPWPRTRYVAVSEDRRAMLAELLGRNPAHIAMIPPGIDLAGFLKLEPETAALAARLDLPAGSPLLLLPARITRRKNIELAIRITAALRAQGHAARLVITGPPGPHNPTNAAYLAELQALREASGAGDAVVFLYEQHTDPAGRPLPVSDAMLGDLYRLADALLFPSRAEGFGIPMLEAGLSGIPIFCSDLPPLRATAGPAATYFHPDDPPDQIARRIAAALAADRRAQLRRQIRTSCTWEAIYRQAIAPLLA